MYPLDPFEVLAVSGKQGSFIVQHDTSDETVRHADVLSFLAQITVYLSSPV